MRTFFILIILVAGQVACNNKKTARDNGVYYTCSMDPQVIADHPGKCPICKMELTPVKKMVAQQNGDLQLSDQQIRLGNIQADTIRAGNIGEEIILTGILNLDGTKTSAISARLMGRVEKLYVKNIGDYVSRGMPLYELYSEELNNARQEYVQALQRRKLFTDQSVINFEEIIQSAANKLRLWGLSEAQVKALDSQATLSPTTTFYSPEAGYITAINVTEGGYTMEGGTILQLADLSTLWAEAQVYPTQLSRVPGRGTANVEVPAAAVEVKGKIELANPELVPGSGINIVRISIPNTGNKLRPGMPAYISMKLQEKNALNLPTDAVIRERKGATVWLQTGSNSFRSQMVRTGMESNAVIEITSGLKPGDVVVMNGAYLLNSEYIFKRGTDPMSSHGH